MNRYLLHNSVGTRYVSTMGTFLYSRGTTHPFTHCVLSDIDGTLVTSDHTMSERLVNSIKQLTSLGIAFIPATGRSRKSMADITGTHVVSLFGSSVDLVPGIYNQGLQVYGLDGELIYEKFLDLDVLAEAIKVVDLLKTDVIAYAGDGIFARDVCAKTNEILASYGEPAPDVFPLGLNMLHEQSNGARVNKLIIVDDESVLERIRPELTKLLEGKASITKAVKGMLEILPLGSSKGEGVQKFFDHYNIPNDKTMAFGDGENDIEMLQLVRMGVAVANARPQLKKVANALTYSNNDDGVAFVLDMFGDEDKEDDATVVCIGEEERVKVKELD